jgi:hypothetical protein
MTVCFSMMPNLSTLCWSAAEQFSRKPMQGNHHNEIQLTRQRLNKRLCKAHWGNLIGVAPTLLRPPRNRNPERIARRGGAGFPDFPG